MYMTATRYSSTGWFYGFKLHISINDRNEILGFCITPRNKDDRNPEVMRHLTENIVNTSKEGVV